jgi:tetratricopeptide (TPR) repeat protein
LQASNLIGLGSAYRRSLGQVEQAIKLYEEALTIAREIGDRRREGFILGRLGNAYRNLGQFEQSIELCEEALTIAHETGDRYESVWLGNLGIAYRALGQIERAINLYEGALAITREIGGRQKEGFILGHLSRAYRNLGQFRRSIKLLEKALVIAHEIGDRLNKVIWFCNLGIVHCILWQVKQAITYYEESLTIAREIGYRRGESYGLLGLGKAMLATGELSEAHRYCTEALALDVPETSYQAALALGIVLLCQRDPVAGETFADAVARCRAMLDKTADLYEPRYALAAALVGSAVCNPRWAQEGEWAGLLAPALEEYQRALENCAAPGVVQDAFRDLEMIRAAGVEGLEPAFALLESARP